jgi:hypothetical protein
MITPRNQKCTIDAIMIKELKTRTPQVVGYRVNHHEQYSVLLCNAPIHVDAVTMNTTSKKKEGEGNENRSPKPTYEGFKIALQNPHHRNGNFVIGQQLLNCKHLGNIGERPEGPRPIRRWKSTHHQQDPLLPAGAGISIIATCIFTSQDLLCGEFCIAVGESVPVNVDDVLFQAFGRCASMREAPQFSRHVPASGEASDKVLER